MQTAAEYAIPAIVLGGGKGTLRASCGKGSGEGGVASVQPAAVAIQASAIRFPRWNLNVFVRRSMRH